MTSTIENPLTVAEAAATLHVAQSTIRRWIREGRLPAYRIGQRRVALREQDVARMIEPMVADAGQNDVARVADEPKLPRQRTPFRTLGESIEQMDRMLWRDASMDQNGLEDERNRRRTPEEKRKALEALKRASENAARLAAKYGSNWTPSTLELIHEGRDERTRQLMNDCD